MVLKKRWIFWLIVTLIGGMILGEIWAVQNLSLQNRLSQKEKTQTPQNTAPAADAPPAPGFLPDTGSIQVDVYDTLELVFQAATSPSNPFDTYLLKLKVTDPSGSSFTLDGFFDGNGQGGQNGKIWKARLTPYQPGVWSWQTVPGDAADANLAGKSGQFQAVAAGNRGGLVTQGKSFRFQNGDYVYLVGNFLDFTNGLRSTHTYMSETTSDGQRDAIFTRQRDFHTVNKVNLYFANKGDYSSQSVTPWVGTAASNDKSKLDLSRWKKYDAYLQRFKGAGMAAELWFFADDSNFGGLSAANKNRLARYAMARTSAFSHTLYVLALEWQEGWSAQAVKDFGAYVQAHNPWGRVVSVHSLTLSDWKFPGESWAGFIASQPGNDSGMEAVARYAVDLYNRHNLPHLSEEQGILKSESSDELRSRMWAAVANGAAGIGTGSDLKALQRFLSQSRMPFQQMQPANHLVEQGGNTRFALVEPGHHYLVYSASGSFSLQVSGGGLVGYWFNPRQPDAALSDGFPVNAGSVAFDPPGDATQDWVLWITDGTNLNPGTTQLDPGKPIICIPVGSSAQIGSVESGILGAALEPLLAPFRVFLPLTVHSPSGGGGQTPSC